MWRTYLDGEVGKVEDKVWQFGEVTVKRVVTDHIRGEKRIASYVYCSVSCPCHCHRRTRRRKTQRIQRAIPSGLLCFKKWVPLDFDFRNESKRLISKQKHFLTGGGALWFFFPAIGFPSDFVADWFYIFLGKSLDLILLSGSSLYCMHGSSGCLACYSKNAPKTKVNEPPKRLLNEHRTEKKPSISEDFWTTSTWDMDNSAVQSQGSISSISTNQTLDPHGGSGSNSTPSEFVNHGKWVIYRLLMTFQSLSRFGSLITCLLLWNQTRHRWVGNKKSESPSKKIREPKLSTHCLSMVKSLCPCSWNASYESLLGSSKPFPQPIPLPEMVDFLVDIWEQEGLYD
ncbi:hypothetical protein FF2_024870 [Malus domestica]